MSGSLVPAGVDPAIPHGARIYDQMLGGKDSYEADRKAAGAMVTANRSSPSLPGAAGERAGRRGDRACLYGSRRRSWTTRRPGN
ncbi:SAM-dependent methyltransferase [Actinomadura adrarensis]|uniref:SAM-dependent methyltransferase n=1 Tax=Actinomadura adrarensis TaxID=1819600 RepID=A0ABW3CQ74_9ACTN